MKYISKESIVKLRRNYLTELHVVSTLLKLTNLTSPNAIISKPKLIFTLVTND